MDNSDGSIAQTMHRVEEAGTGSGLYHVEMQELQSNRRRISHQTERGYFKTQTAGPSFVNREDRSNGSQSYQLTRAEFEAANWLDCVLTSSILNLQSSKNREYSLHSNPLEARKTSFKNVNGGRSILTEEWTESEQFYERRPQSSAKSEVMSREAEESYPLLAFRCTEHHQPNYYLAQIPECISHCNFMS
jgi:hypothetical protein